MRGAIVICGPIGSGKSTVAAYLASKLSIRVISFGNYIRHMAHRSGLPATRSALQDLGDGLYQQSGASGLLQGALDVAGMDNNETVVFDGVRHIEVLAEIRRRAGKTIAVYLDVGPEERYRRRQAQGSNVLSQREFEVIDVHPVEAEIGKLAGLCDFVIDASQPLSRLEGNLPADLFTLDVR